MLYPAARSPNMPPLGPRAPVGGRDGPGAMLFPGRAAMLGLQQSIATREPYLEPRSETMCLRM